VKRIRQVTLFVMTSTLNMYCINKIVGWVASPFGMLFIGLGFVWLLNATGWRKSARGLLSAVLATLWFLGCGIATRVIGIALESPWEREGVPHGSIEGLPAGDAIVVLGGGMGAHAKCGAAEMFSGADRTWTGAKLYKAGKAKTVILSGGGVEKSTLPLLEDLGVPREAVRFFPDARNTEEESKMIFASLGGMSEDGRRPKVLLVTSAWHMSRAKLLFDRAGFDVVAAPTDFEMSCAREAEIKIGDFFPNADSLNRNSYALKELVANLGYRLLRR